MKPTYHKTSCEHCKNKINIKKYTETHKFLWQCDKCNMFNISFFDFKNNLVVTHKSDVYGN